MTETVMDKELVKMLKPVYVAPFVLYMCHESFEETGGLYEVGAGYIAKQRWQRTKGHLFDTESLTPEGVRNNWGKVVDWEGATNPSSNEEMMGFIFNALDE